jgi:hypothetical protein
LTHVWCHFLDHNERDALRVDGKIVAAAIASFVFFEKKLTCAIDSMTNGIDTDKTYDNNVNNNNSNNVNNNHDNAETPTTPLDDDKFVYKHGVSDEGNLVVSNGSVVSATVAKVGIFSCCQ